MIGDIILQHKDANKKKACACAHSFINTKNEAFCLEHANSDYFDSLKPTMVG